MNSNEAHLLGFLHAARLPGSPTIHHRDIVVMEEAAKFLNLACEHRNIPHIQLHHLERSLHGREKEAVLVLPPEIVKEIDRPLGALFEMFRSDQFDLERGIFEGCGTLCYKKSTRGIEISFTSFERDWLETLRREIEKHHPCLPIRQTERGKYWFSIEEEAARRYADRLYGNPAAPHSPSRKRKLLQVLRALEPRPD
ncbi:MAG TPA: hypothetical protein VFA47_14005 [Candidatus Manganitrophaceae bacterium]|nr:hypothetical protein [Candidatus Manganitrophaceae bacterium]